MIKVGKVSGNMVTCNFNYSLQTVGKGLFLELVWLNFTLTALFITTVVIFAYYFFVIL